MNFYKRLRKDPTLTREQKIARIDDRLGALAPRFAAAFGATRPSWRHLLDWIERVEFEIPPTPVSQYSLMKRRWRFDSTIPAMRPRSRLLDLGCGLGTDAILLHVATGVRVAGIDMDDLSLDTCRVRLKHYRSWLRLADDAILDPRKMNATNLAFDAVSFDAVWSNESVEHIHPPEDLFREIARVLSPGGTVFVLNQNGFSVYEQLKALRKRGLRVYAPDVDPINGKQILIAEERLLTPHACARMLQQAGFDDASVRMNGTIPSPIARLASPDALARVDGMLCRLPIIRSQASDFVLIARKTE
jgi:SAM-dependent methyltransferase